MPKLPFSAISSIVCAAVVFCAAGQACFGLSSQELAKVVVGNETGKTLRYLFSSPSDSQQWGPDLLGAKSMRHGTALSYFIHYPGNRARFDLLALDTENYAYLVEGFAMQEGRDTVIQLTTRHCIGPSRALAISHVYITNASKYSFSYLFFSPERSSSWGFDILNDRSNLEPGESLSFTVPVGEKPYDFEILALSREQAIVQKQVRLSQAKPQVFIDFTVDDLH